MADQPNLPSRILAWQLHDAGLENLGRDGRPDEIPLPQYGPNELLVRVDAEGLCFSDVKLITQGNQHPRIFGRDLATDPIIPGHEVSLTVVGVGEKIRDRFQVGQRYIVQADVYYGGANIAYGYALPGGLAQYGVIGKEILNGDEGCYLLPVKPDTGYVEAALTEPWACVEHAYRLSYREGLKAGGTAWFIGGATPCCELHISKGVTEDSRPAKILMSGLGEGRPFDSAQGRLRQELLRAREWGAEVLEVERPSSFVPASKTHTGGQGFDDIIIIGNEGALIEGASQVMAREGALCIICDQPLPRAVEVDLGRVHYEGRAYLGCSGPDVAAAYRLGRKRSELHPHGLAWFIGAGGPIGQMHVQRALELEQGPRKVVATDVDRGRLDYMAKRLQPLAQRRGVELVARNPKELNAEDFDAWLEGLTDGKGFDDIVVTAPIAALVEHAFGFLADDGVLNIFAGLPRGTMARLDLSGVYLRNQRLVGSSGSRVVDLQDTLAKTESGALSTNRSLAAIGGMRAAREGLEGVKSGRFPGKVVIFPQIEELELTPLSELPRVLPEVAAKLAADGSWTKQAEEELFRVKGIVL